MAYIQVRVPRRIADAVARGELSQNDLAGLVIRYYSQTLPQNRVIDFQPADDGKVKTQEVWIPYFNEQKKPMVSAPDVYRAGQEGNPRLIARLKRDFGESWLVSSTRESYKPDTLNARITHNHGSTVVQPTSQNILVPVYSDKPLDQVLKDNDGVAYLQVKFGTQDKPDAIEKTLADLSGKSPDLIRVWTPDQANRANYSERAAGFDFGGGQFLVSGGYGADDDSGRSRGVSIKSEKPTRKNKR